MSSILKAKQFKANQDLNQIMRYTSQEWRKDIVGDSCRAEKLRIFKFSVGPDIPDYVTSNNEEPRNQIRDIIKRFVKMKNADY